MDLRFRAGMFSACMLFTPALALGQFHGFALYDVGVGAAGLGGESGGSALVYGVGAGGSYGFLSQRELGLVVGADVVIRGFGLKTSDRFDLDAAVFDQTDVWIDEFVAIRIRRLTAGLYLEQRSIDRGRAGAIGSPASGVGLLAEVSHGSRLTARLSYARFPGGHLKVDGVATEPGVRTGRSFRATVLYRLSDRWSTRGEYADTDIEFESLLPTFSFFDHQHRSMTVGVALDF